MSVSSALVIGGGVTGSVLALALAERGVSVHLVELSPVWRGVGHGITVQGNALAALAKIGVLGEVLGRGVPFNQLRMRQADGTLIAEVPTPRTGGPELPATLGALRSDLQDVLCERVYAAGVTVRLGLTVRGLAQDAHRAYAEFSDGSTGRYDLVVGADGIRSTVRAMLGIATTPQPTGMSIWRVVADRPAEMDCAEVYYGGPRYKAGYAPISADKCYAYILDTDGTLRDFGDQPAWELMYERPDARGCAQPPSCYLRRIWYDALVYTPPALRHLIEVVGADKVMLGTDYPFDMGVTDPVERAAAAGLPAADLTAVLSGNAATLFGIS